MLIDNLGRGVAITQRGDGAVVIRRATRLLDFFFFVLWRRVGLSHIDARAGGGDGGGLCFNSP